MIKESLAEYLDRIMKQRNLKVADLQALSGLSQTYINRLLKGTQNNLTVETIGILAQALEVDGFELFAAAYGKTLENTNVDLLILADTINKIILNPFLVEFVQNTAKLKSKKHQKVVLDTVRSLAAKDKASKKSKK
jgi:transcriptional regulator with XRE-family HTH domain